MLWTCADGERRGIYACFRERARQLLPPVRHVPRRAAAVEHMEQFGASVGHLVKHKRWDKDGLLPGDGLPLIAEAHPARAGYDKIHFLLLLIMPGNLPAARFRRHVAEGKVGSLNRKRPPPQGSACGGEPGTCGPASVQGLR